MLGESVVKKHNIPVLTHNACITATGGSAMKAVEVIMSHGVPEDRIIFINLVRAHLSLSSTTAQLQGLSVITFQGSLSGSILPYLITSRHLMLRAYKISACSI
jgi:hypothetical protein